MGECHYCFDCGRCRGETPPAVYVHRCPACRYKNPHGSKVCEACGESLLLEPTRVYVKKKPAVQERKTISSSAERKLVEMEELKMKAAFGDAGVFAALLEQSREAYGKPFELPEYVSERVAFERWTAEDGTTCFTLFPQDVEPVDAWRDKRHVLYFHGGGLVMEVGPPHWEFCLALVEALQCAVTVPIYPLLPLGTWREAHASIMGAYQGVLDRAGDHAADVVVMGDSAGGLLAISLTQLCLAQGLRKPHALVTLSPMTDLNSAVPLTEKQALESLDPLIGFVGLAQIPALWVPDESERDAFPPCALAGPLADMPPQWVFAGSRESLLPEMRLYAQRVEEAGSPIVFDVREGLWHTYPLMLDIDEGREAFDAIVGIVRKAWAD